MKSTSFKPRFVPRKVLPCFVFFILCIVRSCWVLFKTLTTSKVDVFNLNNPVLSVPTSKFPDVSSSRSKIFSLKLLFNDILLN